MKINYTAVLEMTGNRSKLFMMRRLSVA